MPSVVGLSDACNYSRITLDNGNGPECYQLADITRHITNVETSAKLVLKYLETLDLQSLSAEATS
ncbi:4826_t:CDS:2, partial [Paraglomus occultum]